MSGAVSAAGLAMTAAGAVAGASAARSKAESDKNAYEYQAAVNRNNAQYAEMQAADALQRGVRTEQTQRLKTAGLKGTQRASLAARGVALGEGSPLAILQDTEFMGEMDVQTIRGNTEREAWAFRQQAMNYQAEAGLLESTASAIDPNRAAITSLLSGGGQVAGSWYKYQRRT